MSADVTKCIDMTEAMDEKMEVCPLSDVVEKEPKVEDLADSPYNARKPRNEMSRDITLSQIVEGKREKKTVQRLDFQVAKPAKVLKVENGGGDKLGDIVRVNHHLGKLKVPDLKPLHTILFDMPGKIATMRKNMRLFNGFPFEVDSDPYIKKKERMMKITCVRLRNICKVLDLEKGGNQSVLIDRIMTFLMSPRISGKPVISKRKKKSKKNISTKDSRSKTKAKDRSASSSPRKVKAESKSKAIVTDSSSDDDEDDEQGVTVEQDESDAEKKSGKEGKRERVTTDDDTDDSEDYDDEDPKSNPAAKGKRTPSKKRAQPAKKAAPAKKKTKVEDSDLSESDSDKDEDEKDGESEVEKPKNNPAAKRAAPVKPAAKTKKADSSSNNQKKTANKGNAALDSSDDDEPLIKMIKKPPTDEQLKETVKRLLKDANLEEMTMKKICQKVYDTYPDYDLTSRKDYVKQTVKTLIS
ncbi:protein DEK isoform X1 [Salmo salar]|uniref:Protein DEK n=1 Tax=Salmo salar TaxID=8030 RepID=A0A1S3NP16_SALSA|nr:protein DEK isoform X1 [Salmo salar]|eukprot:XP_014017129.1 PREDICTED: protein DEK-like isoform X1 [Salmo salar]